MAAGLVVLSPRFGQELLPYVQGAGLPDALVDQARHVSSGNGPHLDVSLARTDRTIPGVRNCGSHIGQALLMDEVYGILFSARTGPVWILMSTMTRRWPPFRALVDGYPGLYRDVQTYLKERIREVLDRLEPSDRRAHLWPGPGYPAR